MNSLKIITLHESKLKINVLREHKKILWDLTSVCTASKWL